MAYKLENKVTKYGVRTPELDWEGNGDTSRMWVMDQEYGLDLNPLRMAYETLEEAQELCDQWNAMLPEDTPKDRPECLYVVESFQQEIFVEKVSFIQKIINRIKSWFTNV